MESPAGWTFPTVGRRFLSAFPGRPECLPPVPSFQFAVPSFRFRVSGVGFPVSAPRRRAEPGRVEVGARRIQRRARPPPGGAGQECLPRHCETGAVRGSPAGVGASRPQGWSKPPAGWSEKRIRRLYRPVCAIPRRPVGSRSPERPTGLFDAAVPHCRGRLRSAGVRGQGPAVRGQGSGQWAAGSGQSDRNREPRTANSPSAPPRRATLGRVEAGARRNQRRAVQTGEPRCTTLAAADPWPDAGR
jgi:hypothetical protein